MKRTTFTVLVALSLLSLSGCGGGSDKGSGGQFDGFYRGTETINGTTLALDVNIKGGRVTITDVADDEWKGDVNSGGDFRATRRLPAFCNGESRYQGQVTGNVIKGTFREVVGSPRRSSASGNSRFKPKR